jgi:predicted nucleotide-binding protein
MFGLFKDRVRQNVILEFGYFVGRIGRNKVCCLLKGSIELPSDMNGICYFNFENSVSEVWERILKELRAAGYEVKPERVTSKFRT